MTPYPDYARLRTTIQALLTNGTIAWAGTLYRIVDPHYSNPTDLISGVGAYRHGSRWNWPGLDHVVFGAVHYAGAFAEWESHALRGGVPFVPGKFRRDMRTFEVRLQRVLDLSGDRALPSLGIDPLKLLDIPWEFQLGMGEEAVTHAVGRAAQEGGAEAILVPCAPKPSVSNLVIFRGNLDPASSITA